MLISLPNRDIIVFNELQRIEAQGLGAIVSGTAPVVFSLDIPVEGLKESGVADIPDDLLEKSNSVQFKYVYKNSVKTGIWTKQNTRLVETRINTLGKIKLVVPTRLSTLKDLVSVCLVLEVQEGTEVKELHLEELQQPYIEVALHLFQKAKKICYRLTFSGNEVENYYYSEHKHHYIFNHKDSYKAYRCVRTNNSPKYSDKPSGRAACLAELDLKILKASGLSSKPFTSKNLLYYSLYFDEGYVELFDLSVCSILENSAAAFDILVITDKQTKRLIEKTKAASLADIKYYITDTPADGIDASKKKIAIYKYENIKEYGKVLFLDCDTVAVDDIDKIFSTTAQGNRLFSVKHDKLNSTHFRTVHHGFAFNYLDEDFLDEVRVALQQPFNAGQFYFVSSEIMLEHFSNVDWLMRNWPSEYFFEQSYMNYYFAKAYCTNVELLDKLIYLKSTDEDIAASEDIGSPCILHFAAPPLDSAAKLAYIKNFLKEYNNYEQSSSD